MSTPPDNLPAPSGPAPDAPQPPPVATAPSAAKAPPKPFFVRTFSLTLGQGLRLFFLSTLIGFFVLAFDYAPAGATFDIGGAFTAIIHRALTAIGWAFQSFWKPALAGAIVVMPLWALWRLASVPFRKK